jgi:hypothetical protein
MRNSISILLLFILYLISIPSCKEDKQPAEAQTAAARDSLPPDFVEFYKKFHQDSDYQLAHITFPLSGTLRDSSGLDSAVTWTRENWKHHQAVIPDEFWSVDFTIPLEGIIVEFIHARQGGYWMERRFARMDTSWNLIFYKGLQSPERTEEEIDSLIESGVIEID